MFGGHHGWGKSFFGYGIRDDGKSLARMRERGSASGPAGWPVFGRAILLGMGGQLTAREYARGAEGAEVRREIQLLFYLKTKHSILSPGAPGSPRLGVSAVQLSVTGESRWGGPDGSGTLLRLATSGSRSRRAAGEGEFGATSAFRLCLWGRRLPAIVRWIRRRFGRWIFFLSYRN